MFLVIPSKCFHGSGSRKWKWNQFFSTASTSIPKGFRQHFCFHFWFWFNITGSNVFHFCVVDPDFWKVDPDPDPACFGRSRSVYGSTSWKKTEDSMDLDTDSQHCFSYIRFEILKFFVLLLSSSLTRSFFLKAHVAKGFDTAIFWMMLVQGGGSKIGLDPYKKGWIHIDLVPQYCFGYIRFVCLFVSYFVLLSKMPSLNLFGML